MLELNKDNIYVSASVSCMDLCNLEWDIKRAEEGEISFYHFDVVDGRFNECFILGETTLSAMKKKAKLPIEVHLAVYEPEKYIKRFIDCGADYVAVHYEAMDKPVDTFEYIRSLGAVPILAYKSTTAPGEDFAILAKEVPWVLKLTVNPGFSGQKIQPKAVEHIRQMKDIIEKNNLNTLIQADGNINSETIPLVVKNGAGILTGGTSGLFLNGKSVKECAQLMKNIGMSVKKVCE